MLHYCDEKESHHYQMQPSGHRTVARVGIFRPPSPAYFRHHAELQTLKAGANCSLTISPPDGHSIMIDVKQLMISERDATLRVINAKSHQVLISNTHANGSSDENFRNDVANDLTVQLITHAYINDKQVEVQIILTSFMEKDPDGQCPDAFYYDCANHRCIREILHCDDVDNCGKVYASITMFAAFLKSTVLF